ncbi:MAG TPA: 16S rRNA (cytosine(1402)-N(4))-methyltransferase RsmH [Acidimicrobiales bacterium]|nr:16S rRNA (cytosine(1402)-N(4))-methyltransferase RsmH [Acidimicrobiales bacterium]
MAQDLYHEPVLASEIVELLASLPAGVVVDATLGGGGHAEALLSAAPQLRLLGIDRDPDARAEATRRLAPFRSRVLIVSATFAELSDVLRDNEAFLGGDDVVAVLMDLGVSSHQLNESTRGFSFRADAPLDMRMDPSQGETASTFLARIDQHELARLLRKNGESRFAGSIAKSVIERQPQTTFELNDAVERAVPMAARRRGHVATRVFQALRVAVNGEEEQLSEGLDAALNALSVGGVMAVISYHSGEDRVVKSFFVEQQSGGCRCSPELGCVCGAIARVKVAKASAQLAGPLETGRNPRARSARLRVARKVAP